MNARGKKLPEGRQMPCKLISFRVFIIGNSDAVGELKWPINSNVKTVPTQGAIKLKTQIQTYFNRENLENSQH